MLPTLRDLEIKPGSFIRKLDNRNHWNAYKDSSDLTQASQLIAEKVFNEQSEKYSLWYVSTEQEFYGVLAALTANATPKDRNIDFIWIAEHELKEVSIAFENIPEGSCVHVQRLHFDAVINQRIAQQLCYNLIAQERISLRCNKAQTILVLEHQHQLGCKAVDTNFQICECEGWG